MIGVPREQWKKFMEGLRRGDIGPFTQNNKVEGPDSLREYSDGRSIVARMHSTGTNPKAAREYARAFSVEDKLIPLIDYIFIPTEAQFAKWEEDGLDIGLEMIAIDPGYG